MDNNILNNIEGGFDLFQYSWYLGALILIIIMVLIYYWYTAEGMHAGGKGSKDIGKVSSVPELVDAINSLQ